MFYFWICSKHLLFLKINFLFLELKTKYYIYTIKYKNIKNYKNLYKNFISKKINTNCKNLLYFFKKNKMFFLNWFKILLFFFKQSGSFQKSFFLTPKLPGNIHPWGFFLIILVGIFILCWNKKNKLKNSSGGKKEI